MPFASNKGEAYSKDNFFIQAMGGKGLGRYMNETVNLGAAVNNTTRDLDMQTAWGGFVGYRHYWLDNLRSTAVYGMTHVNLKDYLASTTTKETNSVHANLIWSPVPSTDVGVEYIWGRREIKSGDTGEMNRIQGSVKYSF